MYLLKKCLFVSKTLSFEGDFVYTTDSRPKTHGFSPLFQSDFILKGFTANGYFFGISFYKHLWNMWACQFYVSG